MKQKSTKTAGKRTARPGSRAEDNASRTAVGRNKRLPASGGQKTTGVTGTQIVGHQRAAGQRQHNKGNKK